MKGKKIDKADLLPAKLLICRECEAVKVRVPGKAISVICHRCARHELSAKKQALIQETTERAAAARDFDK